MTQSQNFYTPSCEVKITDAKCSPEGLLVYFDGVGDEQFYSWFWVRDHGIDADSLDQITLQRLTDTFSIPKDIVCSSIEFDAAQQVIDMLWPDGSKSTISAYMLASVIGLCPGRHELVPGKNRILWDKDYPLDELPSVQFDTVMTGDDGLREWLENIHIYGFSLVDGVPSTEQDTAALAYRIGRVQQTIFGDMWPLSSELKDHGDTAYTTDYLEPHTDATYYHDAPGLQMFNCLEFNGKGGESIQVDAFAIAARIKREDPDAYRALTEISVPGHYIEPGVHLRAERPPFVHDSQGHLIQVSFNNYDRAPLLLSDEESNRFHYAYGLFHQHAIDQDNWLKIPLTPGKTLIFDNWRNMHGRMGYTGQRRFYGCYHSRAEFESKLRVLQAGAQEPR